MASFRVYLICVVFVSKIIQIKETFRVLLWDLLLLFGGFNSPQASLTDCASRVVL